MKFQTTILQSGKTATGFVVPPDVVEALGAGKRPPVNITIGGHTYRSTVAVMGGEFMLPLSAENRHKAEVSAGDEVDVEIELDTQPREVEIPTDFDQALEKEAEARRFFDGLSYSQKRRIVLGIQDAKTEATRQRRIEKAVSMLQEGRAQ